MRKLLLLASSFLCAGIVFCGCSDLFEEDISNGKVEMLSPPNDAGLHEGDVKFIWELTKGATGYRFSIVSRNDTAGNMLIVDELITPDSLAWNVCCEYFLPAGKYRWTVQAMNSIYKTNKSIRDLTVYAEGEDIGDGENKNPQNPKK